MALYNQSTSGRRKSSARKKPLGLIFGVLAVVGLLGVLEATDVINLYDRTPDGSSAQGDNSNIYKPATEQEKKEVEDNKTGNNQPSGTPSDPAPSNPVVIRSAEQQNTEDAVVVQTALYGVGWKECKLTFSKGSTKFTKTSDTLYQPNFSTCLGFSVPLDQFNQSGEWQVSLNASKSDGTTQKSESKNLTVTK